MFALIPLILIVSFTLVYMASGERAWRESSDAALLTWLGAMERAHRAALAEAARDARIDDEGTFFVINLPDHRVYQFDHGFISYAIIDTRNPGEEEDAESNTTTIWRAVVTYTRPDASILTARDIGFEAGGETVKGRLETVGARRLTRPNRIFGLAAEGATIVADYSLPPGITELTDGDPVLVTRFPIRIENDTPPPVDG